MRIIVVIGAALILSGFLGWTVPVSENKTVIYLNYMCTSGSQHLSQEGGISCSLLNQLTYIVYALLIAGIILIAVDIAFKNKKPFQKRVKT
jgi:low temperature requirement protein LtrA